MKMLERRLFKQLKACQTRSSFSILQGWVLMGL